MIYFISKATELPSPVKHYEKCSVEKSLEILRSMTIIGLDTETQGLDPHTKKLLSVQMGNKDIQVVVDCSTIDIHLYREILEDEKKLFLLCNAKFDLQFFYQQHIIVSNVWDVMLAERLMHLGYPSGTFEANLKALCLKYLDIDLDKSTRGKIIKRGIYSDDVIVYAANDVVHLEDIKEKQEIELGKKGLMKAIQYENHYCKVIAYIEWCGVKLDVPRWKEKMAKDNARLLKAKESLDNWVVKHYPNDNRFIFRDMQGDLFNGFHTGPQCKLNWGSQKQVIPLFKELGFDLLVKDKATGKMKESVEAEVIETQKDISDISTIYLEYKAASKVTSTYGQNVLDQINPETGRIYTEFNQLGTATGRLSSGGGGGKIKKLNFQNFPADKETRACFISEKGYKFISCDYSGQESRILAGITKDSKLVDLYLNGCGDMHSLVAKMTFIDDIPRDFPIEKIKGKFHDLRNKAKKVEFAINYGGNGSTIAMNVEIPKEEGDKIYNQYMASFTGISTYQDKQRRFVDKYGYIILNEKSGHKSFVYNFDEFVGLKLQLDRDFWNKYREIPRDDSGRKSPRSRAERDMKDTVVRYFKLKSKIEKHGINYPCQGTGAVMHKLSCIFFFKWLKEKNYLFKVRIVIPVHDELNVEAPNGIADEVAKSLVKCMYDAGEYLCGEPHFPADPEISDHWVH